MSGIEDKKRGGAHFREAAAYDEFRKSHARVVGTSKLDTRSEPLPDFDFASRELVLVWGGTMARSVEIVAVRDGIVEAKEILPNYDEEMVARMINVGTYKAISIPRGAKPVEVRWVR